MSLGEGHSHLSVFDRRRASQRLASAVSLSPFQQAFVDQLEIRLKRESAAEVSRSSHAATPLADPHPAHQGGRLQASPRRRRLDASRLSHHKGMIRASIGSETPATAQQ